MHRPTRKTFAKLIALVVGALAVSVLVAWGFAAFGKTSTTNSGTVTDREYVRFASEGAALA